MKTLAPIVAVALGAGTACAQIAILDGNFDSLPVGTAPDNNVPAGAWGFYDPSNNGEVTPDEMSIVPTGSFDAGASGNSLRVSVQNLDPSLNTHLSNNFLSPYVEGDPHPLVVNFDVWVSEGTAGGSFYLGKGFNNATDRAAQITWMADGTLTSTGSDGANTTRVNGYIRDAWQSIRIELDLGTDTYDLFYGPRGGPLALVGDDVGFRSGPQTMVTRATVVLFGGVTPNALSYFDNFDVVPSPATGSLLGVAGFAMLRRRRQRG